MIGHNIFDKEAHIILLSFITINQSGQQKQKQRNQKKKNTKINTPNKLNKNETALHPKKKQQNKT